MSSHRLSSAIPVLRDRKDFLAASGIWLAVLFIYILLPTRDFYWDGVAYAIDIEHASSWLQLFHPNHLLYTLLGAGIWHAAQAVGLPTRALFAMATLNSVLSAVAATLVYRLLYRWTRERYVSVAVALGFAFSATWWKFSTDADPYIASTLCLLGCFSLLEQPGRHVLGAACLHAGAMLLHQLAIFFFPAALFLLWRRYEHRASDLTTYLLATVGLVSSGYLAAYEFADIHGREKGFLAWVTAHSPDDPASFSLVRDVSLTLQSHLKLLLGGKLDTTISPACVAAAVAAMSLALAVNWPRPATPPASCSNTRSTALLLWLGAYLPFLFFWRPQDTFHRLFYVPPAALLIGLTFARQSVRLRTVFAGAALLFGVNLVLFIYPNTQVAAKPALAFALQQAVHWPAGTRVIYRDFYPDLWTISYFNSQAAWLSMNSPDLAALRRYEEECRKYGVPLWLEGQAFDLVASDAAGSSWLAQHSVEPLTFQARRHSFRFYHVM